MKSCNILRGLPFLENEVDAIYSCHMLEHFTCEQAEKFIAECHRVLKPEGIIRIVVPDLEDICREYLKILELVRKNKEYAKKYEYIVIELLDQMTRMFSGGEMEMYWKMGECDEEYVKYRTGKPEAGEVRKRAGIKKLLKKELAEVNRVLMKLTFYRKWQLGNFMLSGELHKWMYDSYSLTALLEKKGFRECKIMKYNESYISNWTKWKLELRKDDGTEYKPHSLYIEGIK